jgi:hypothetical protein
LLEAALCLLVEFVLLIMFCRSSTLANNACVSIVFGNVATSSAESGVRLRSSSIVRAGLFPRTLAAFFRDRGGFLATRGGPFLTATCFDFVIMGSDCVSRSWEPQVFKEDVSVLLFDDFASLFGTGLGNGKSRFGGSISLSLWLSITGAVEGLGL